ncbi:translation initiation factor IF-2-like [Cebus imitator]|uniref:translation initiation factor IF-2-like n=1 Tax=Cebus imitator TaxID=2715852 RepID=UPI00189A74FD|nr:translation initiation factor IF-2-like [Cebus imitator]
MWGESGAGRSPQCGAWRAQPMGSADGGARGGGAGAGRYFSGGRASTALSGRTERSWRTAAGSYRPLAAGAGDRGGGGCCCCWRSPGDTTPACALPRAIAAPQGPVRTRLGEGELWVGASPVWRTCAGRVPLHAPRPRRGGPAASIAGSKACNRAGPAVLRVDGPGSTARPRRPSLPAQPGLRHSLPGPPSWCCWRPGLRSCRCPRPRPPGVSRRCVEAPSIRGRGRGGGEGSGVTRLLLPPPPPSGASFLQLGRPVTPALFQAGRGRAADRPGPEMEGGGCFLVPQVLPFGTATLWGMG